MEKDFESVMEKFRKLQALAERGETGEAKNARAAIERLCAQYHVSIDELTQEEKKKYTFEVGQKKIMQELFLQCYSKIADTNSLKYWKRGKTQFVFELTRFQYVELSSLWDWHKEHFVKELEETQAALLVSYCRKHTLYSMNDEDVGHRELTEKEKAAILRSMYLDGSLTDEMYQKRLEAL